jgi:5-methylcytosine-specific restriction endonuclease McrA
VTPDPKPTKRVKDPAALRAYRLEMQGEPCMACELRRGEHVHHVKFRSQGGGDVAHNLMWLCRYCHDLAHGIRSY